MPQSSASALRTLRAPSGKSSLERAAAALDSPAVSAPGPVPVPPPAPAAPPAAPAKTHDLDIIGPRKLIRPHLPEGLVRSRRTQRQDETPYLWRPAAPSTAAAHEASSAEAFYFQKQIQTQTPMVFILDDGEKIEGCIEWYDRDVIKVRCSASPFRGADHATRVLIYKSGIKYLYKAGENQPQY